MAEKCFLCGEKIEETFLEKKDGTLVKIKNNGGNKAYFICSSCQKGKGDIKGEVIRKLG